jgi:Fe-S-cluster-containing dehydrogenase component
MSCKDEHVGNDWPGYTAQQPRHGHRWMNIERRERGQYPRNDVAYLPMPCQHCENAPCIAAGKGAVTRRDDGIVMIDMDKAKGNEALAKSCPYDAIYWNAEFNVPQKCTMCAHLIDDKEWTPGIPRCAHTCPTGAIQFYTKEPADMEKIISSEGIEAYKAELGTKPHVLYKNLYKFTKNYITAGVLVNGECYENATVTLKSKDKVIGSSITNFFGEFKFDGLDDGSYALEIDASGKKTTSVVTIDGESKNLGFIKL